MRTRSFAGARTLPRVSPSWQVRLPRRKADVTAEAIVSAVRIPRLRQGREAALIGGAAERSSGGIRTLAVPARRGRLVKGRRKPSAVLVHPSWLSSPNGRPKLATKWPRATSCTAVTYAADRLRGARGDELVHFVRACGHLTVQPPVGGSPFGTATFGCSAHVLAGTLSLNDRASENRMRP
jgi:hypothetical protein